MSKKQKVELPKHIVSAAKAEADTAEKKLQILNPDNALVKKLVAGFEKAGIPFSEKFVMGLVEEELSEQAEKIVVGIIKGATFSVLLAMINPEKGTLK